MKDVFYGLKLDCCVLAAVLFIFCSSKETKAAELKNAAASQNLCEICAVVKKEVSIILTGGIRITEGIKNVLDKLTGNQISEPEKIIRMAVDDTALPVLKSNATDEEKKTVIKNLLERFVDFDHMAKLSLGADFKSLSAEGKRKYCDEFKEDFLSKGNLCKTLKKSTSFKIVKQWKSEDRAEVETNIGGGMSADYSHEVIYKVVFVFYLRGNQWLVTDFIVEGSKFIVSNHEVAQALAAKIIKDAHDQL